MTIYVRSVLQRDSNHKHSFLPDYNLSLTSAKLASLNGSEAGWLIIGEAVCNVLTRIDTQTCVFVCAVQQLDIDWSFEPVLLH